MSDYAVFTNTILPIKDLYFGICALDMIHIH